MRPFRRLRAARGGFTLVEALATLALVAIILPVAMRGITLATAAAKSRLLPSKSMTSSSIPTVKSSFPCHSQRASSR